VNNSIVQNSIIICTVLGRLHVLTNRTMKASDQGSMVF
jgi:hypothetical protein